MKVNTKRKVQYGIIGVIILLLAVLAYIYFVMLQSGGGIVSANKKTVGKIESLFSIYGPGRGIYPRFNRPMSVATDANDNIYVSDSGNNRIAVFDRDGNFKFEFGTFGIAKPLPGDKANWAPGKFSFPYGIDTDDATGNIFVADMVNGRIQVFDPNGKFQYWFPKEPIKFGVHTTDLQPLALDVSNGKVYICNPFQVMIFTTDGKFLKAIGMPGDQKGQFDRPNGIAAAADGSFYVSDSNNLRLQAFDPQGKLRWVAGKPSVSEGTMTEDPSRVFGLPRNIAIGPDGNIYVVDSFSFDIKVFSPQGKMLASMGERGTEDGTFNFPNGIAITKDKIIYIADKENNRVQAIRLTGFEIDK